VYWDIEGCGVDELHSICNLNLVKGTLDERDCILLFQKQFLLGIPLEQQKKTTEQGKVNKVIMVEIQVGSKFVKLKLDMPPFQTESFYLNNT